MGLVTGSTLQGQNWLTSHSPFLFSNLLESAAFVSSPTMAPQLDAAQHILIETLLKEGFENQANSLKSLVQRARRPENPSKETAVRNAHPKNKPRRPS